MLGGNNGGALDSKRAVEEHDRPALLVLLWRVCEPVIPCVNLVARAADTEWSALDPSTLLWEG